MTSSRQPEQLRLFVAVTLPAEARDAIARLIQGLRAADLTGVRLVDPDGVHLTLKFLGNVDSSRVPALTDALGRRRRGRRAIRAPSRWCRRVPRPAIPARPVGRRVRRHRRPRRPGAPRRRRMRQRMECLERTEGIQPAPHPCSSTRPRLRRRSPTRRNRSGRHWPPTCEIVCGGGVSPHQEHPHAIRPPLRYRPHRNP